ncbi:MAG: hypothetical protein ACD_58C00228G0001 [uncultured bacterium]|nr:MAG: hypothetical protein ACD_58C00228G0001 [uncultured bacterium]
MHVPGAEGPQTITSSMNQASGPSISFGNGVKPEEKKGEFKIVQKQVAPIAPPVAPPRPPAPVKLKLNPDLWIKYFDPAKGLFKKIKPSYTGLRSTTEEYNWAINSEYWLKMRALLLLALVVVIVLGIGLIGMKSYYNGRLEQYNALVNNVNSINGELRNRDDYRDQSLVLIDQAQAIQTILSERVSWTKMFNVLEAITLDEVSYTDFQIIDSTRINLTVQAPSYASLARQVELFEKTEGIKLADVSDATVAIDKNTDAQEITGLVQLTLTPEFWNK